MIRLSPEQNYAVQAFEEGNNLFITGPGGTGKTLLIQHLVKNAEKREKKIQVCALTGCASLLLNCNARTIHSWSGIRQGKGDEEKIITGVFYNKKALMAWRKTDILVIDETSMMSKKIFELLDKIGRRTRGKYDKPFGGMQVVFVGDFYQLPPVGSMDDPDTCAFCFESNKWKEVFELDNHVVLTTMFRQLDPVYQAILLNIRKGKIDKEQIAILRGYVSRQFDSEANNGCILTKLFPTKARVDYYNQQMFDALEGQSYEFNCITKSNCKAYLDNSNRSGISLQELEKGSNLSKTATEKEFENLKMHTPCIPILSLKKGAAVMCTVNLDMENGICNGSIGIVSDFIVRMNIPVPIIQFSNGIKREIPINYWHSEEFPTIAIGQYPLCLAWAMTIHKIQGATLPMAEMDIGKSIFESGQTYVALSRVKSLQGLYLSHFFPQNIRANEKVAAFYDSIPEVEYEMEEENEENAGMDENKKELDFEAFSYKSESVSDPNIKKIIL